MDNMLYSMLQCIIISLISALTFRIRGGLRIPGTDKKFPICKWWFATAFSSMAFMLKYHHTFDFESINYWIVMLIAARTSTQMAGWGEYCGCVLGIGKPNPERKDFPKVDDFLDNLRWDAFDIKIWKWTIHIPAFNLLDHSILFGWLGLSARGLYLSFLIGLALNSISFMLCGIMMGTIYWLCGLFARKILKKYDKTGWNISEWIFGGYLGLMLYICLHLIKGY